MNDDLLTLQHRATVLKDWTTHESYRILMDQTEIAIGAAFERMLNTNRVEELWEERGAIKAIRQIRSLADDFARQADALRRNAHASN